jgi:hypothetical protein
MSKKDIGQQQGNTKKTTKKKQLFVAWYARPCVISCQLCSGWLIWCSHCHKKSLDFLGLQAGDRKSLGNRG